MNDYMIRQGAVDRYQDLVRQADIHRDLKGVAPTRRPRLDALASLGLALAVVLGRVLG